MKSIAFFNTTTSTPRRYKEGDFQKTLLPSDDVHTQYVRDSLESKGTDYLHLDLSLYPNRFSITFIQDSVGQHEIVFRTDHSRVIMGSEITAIFNRGRMIPSARLDIHDEKVRAIYRAGITIFVASLPLLLPVLWVSSL